MLNIKIYFLTKIILKNIKTPQKREIATNIIFLIPLFMFTLTIFTLTFNEG